MSSQNKILLIAVALVAFIIGTAMNTLSTKSVGQSFEIDELLSAKLLTSSNLEQTTEQHLKEVNLINFWASWCGPCRREMPLFEAVFKQHANNGFQIIGIAIDSPDKAQPMLDSMGITYPILYAEQTGIKLMELSGNETGAMPYSILVDKQGRVIDHKLGEIHEPQLTAWAQGKAYEAN